jgi:regulator of protease activity HflC (stomatin/prohibitin superfamily)
METLRFPDRRSRANLSIGAAIAVIVVLIVLAVVFIGFPRAVDAGEGCVVTRGGDITGTADSGYTFVNVFESLHCLSTRPITYEAALEEVSGSDAQYSDIAVDARSSDGQLILGFPYRIVFHIPAVLPEFDPTTFQPLTETTSDGDEIPVVVRTDNLQFVYENVAQTEVAAVTTVVTTQSRPVVRQVAQLYASERLFAGDLAEPQRQIYERLFPVFLNYGLVLDSVLLSKPKFNDAFESVIETRQIASEQVEVKRQEALQAEQSAAAQVATTQGQAEAARVTAQGDADAQIIRAQANADSITIESQAQADALALQVGAYGGPEYYARVQQYEAIGNWQVTTILGNDSGVLPVYQVPSGEQQPLPSPPAEE